MNQMPQDEAGLSELAALEARLPVSIAELVRRTVPGAGAVAVDRLRALFGGNARKAWSFELGYDRDGVRHSLPCVILVQLGGRQIDSEVAHEFKVLAALNGRGLRIPQAICMDPDGAILGYPSIVLERLDGEANAVKLLRARDVTAAKGIIRDLAGVVAGLHAVEWDAGDFDASLAGLSPSGIARLQLRDWRARFEAGRQEPAPVLAGLYNWLDANLPEPDRIALVHGDLRPGNFLYGASAVTGLLDWEMAHLGDPLEDIGWIYRPLWSPEGLVPLPEFLEAYEVATGRKVRSHHMTYWRIFSEVKFATISMTASKAFATEETRNIRHADRQSKVAPCLWRGLDLIASFEDEARHA